MSTNTTTLLSSCSSSEIEQSSHSYQIYSRAQAFSVGDKLGPIQGTLNSVRHYTTVQYGPAETDHIRLDSDFVFGGPS